MRADALRLPLRDGSVDGAISGFALRNVVDIAACFQEAARVIRPGGRAVFLEVLAVLLERRRPFLAQLGQPIVGPTFLVLFRGRL